MRNHLEFLSQIRKYDLNAYNIVIYGAGNTSVLYQECFKQEEIKPMYYVDNNTAKHNTVFYGVPVISLEDLISLRQTFSKPLLILISSMNTDSCFQIKEQLSKFSLPYIMLDELVFSNNVDKIKTVYDFLEDDFSKEVYAEIIHARMYALPVKEALVSKDTYYILPAYLKLRPSEVFVDLGAYTGDTIEQYLNKKLGCFGEIYAFEPSKVNFSALEYRVARLKNEWAIPSNKLNLVRAGVGRCTEKYSHSPPPPPRKIKGKSRK
jgi:hypothetical protein